MKLINIIAIIAVAMFFFASIGFCNDIEHEDNTSSHCIMHCASGCHVSVPQNNISFITPSAVSFVELPSGAFPKSLVMHEIFRPPKTF